MGGILYDSCILPEQAMRKVQIVDYDARWPAEYVHCAEQIRAAAGDSALRIDHIGSTSVPGLAAKDVIDIQATVADLDDPTAAERLVAAGFVSPDRVAVDFLVGLDEDGSSGSRELRKRYFREPPGNRRVHLHMREDGRVNQRYALLFRDYLRAHAHVARAYEIIKRRLAAVFPHDIDGYLSIKDPYMDTVYEGARHWAELTGWQPDEDFL